MAQIVRTDRRQFLRRTAISGALLSVPALAPALAQASSTPFSIIVLPDTQFYARYDGPADRPKIFARQTEWILDHLASENIVFVSHVGDVVNNGAAKSIEWKRANAAMDTLHGRVPYSVVPGNHDLNRVGSRTSGLSAFVQRYGRARYAGMPWYGGCSSNQVNHFQLFEANGWTFLHLGLELEPPDDALAWAKQIIDAHAGVPTIVSTHSYQNDTTGRPTESEFQGNCGEQVWQKLIAPNPQIFMVLNGHFYAAEGERSQVSSNAAGMPVFELESDYQAYSDGGGGYLRIIRFDPSANTIGIRTYSPWYNQFMADETSEFNFSVDLAERFNTAQASTPTATEQPTPTKQPTAEPTQPPTPTATAGNNRVFVPVADAKT